MGYARRLSRRLPERHRVIPFWRALCVMLLALVSMQPGAAAAADRPNPIAKLEWQYGPAKAKLGDKAEIQIPEGYAYLSAAETKKFMEMNENPSSDGEYLVAPQTLQWFTIFRFDPVGFVKDDDTIDAPALLKSITESQVAGNQERKNRGWPTLTIKGWGFQPRYDRQANLLEWAVAGKDDTSNADFVNYNTRLLGRTGVMEVTLLSAPESLDTSVRSLKDLLKGYSYSAGEKYSEFRAGDHVAEFGLAALIAGGAAAVAAKKGFFSVVLAFLAGAGKFIVAGLAAAAAWIGSLFKKRDRT